MFWWIYPPKFGRRLCEKILCICSQIPPKLSNMIMSSSTPKEWSKSSTVLDASKVACKKKLAREFDLPHFLLLNQTHEVWFRDSQEASL